MATARTKAFVFSAILILVSGAFVATAAASTTSALAPFRRGEDFALERPLSRYGVAIGIRVGATVDASPVPLEGATVSFALLRPDSKASPIVVRTDAEGHAILRIPPGVYQISVVHDSLNATQPRVIAASERIAIYFDEAGNAHWEGTRHRELERKGETHTLLVRVGETSGGRELGPAEGAPVRVYRLLPNGERVGEPAEKRTNARGAAVFQLHQGAYEVEAAWHNSTATKRLRLMCDARAFFVADETSISAVETARNGPCG